MTDSEYARDPRVTYNEERGWFEVAIPPTAPPWVVAGNAVGTWDLYDPAGELRDSARADAYDVIHELLGAPVRLDDGHAYLLIYAARVGGFLTSAYVAAQQLWDPWMSQLVAWGLFEAGESEFLLTEAGAAKAAMLS